MKTIIKDPNYIKDIEISDDLTSITFNFSEMGKNAELSKLSSDVIYHLIPEDTKAAKLTYTPGENCKVKALQEITTISPSAFSSVTNTTIHPFEPILESARNGKLMAHDEFDKICFDVRKRVHELQHLASTNDLSLQQNLNVGPQEAKNKVEWFEGGADKIADNVFSNKKSMFLQFNSSGAKKEMGASSDKNVPIKNKTHKTCNMY